MHWGNTLSNFSPSEMHLHVDQYLEKLLFTVPTIAKICLLFFPVILVSKSIPNTIVGIFWKGISLMVQGMPPSLAHICTSILLQIERSPLPSKVLRQMH